MQSGCSCRKENKDGNPKANRSIKRQDEKGIPFLFLWIQDTSGEFFCGQVKWQGGLPLKERKKFAGL